MTTVEPVSPSGGLVARVKGILLKPDAEWDVIDAEPATISGIYTRYVVPLAAIPVVCGAIGASLIGHGAFGIVYREPVLAVAVRSIFTYGLSLASVYLLAMIIDALAPNFGGVKDRLKAFKVSAYASTAAWIAGVFAILPTLALLAVLGGLYSLFLLYKGLPKLMKAPQDKAAPYLGVVVVIAIVIYVVIFAVVGAVTAATVGLGAAGYATNAGAVSGKVKVGGSEIDLGKLQASARQMEAQAKGETVDGAVQALPGETLKGLLPAAAAGLARTEVESSSAGVAGLQGSNAQGVYTNGDGRITLSLTDMGAAAGLVGMAGAFNVNSSKETATSYQKMGKVGGRMTTEEYDSQARSGEYGVMVADRFMVQAKGSNVTIDQMKSAVSAVPFNQLEALAKG